VSECVASCARLRACNALRSRGSGVRGPHLLSCMRCLTHWTSNRSATPLLAETPASESHHHATRRRGVQRQQQRVSTTRVAVASPNSLASTRRAKQLHTPRRGGRAGSRGHSPTVS
jgi:hypothetical protein